MVHWHGLISPTNVTQLPMPPVGSYTYELEIGQCGFYHSHDHPDRQQALGLYGALLIAPKDRSTKGKADLDYINPAPGMAEARMVDLLSSLADGRRAAKPLHDPRRGLSLD